MKKWIGMVLTLLTVCLFSLVSFTAEENAVLKDGDFQYRLNDDGTVTISGWTGTDEKAVIPEEIDGRAVTTIGVKAFVYCSGLKKVRIPDSVTVIDNGAFGACLSLTEIEIPDSVTTMGVSVFLGCEGLRSVMIPASVTMIGEKAFKGCRGVTLIVERGSYAAQYAEENRIPYKAYANAEEANKLREASRYAYNVNDDGTITVYFVDYDNEDEEIIIPEEIDGRTVAAIGDRAFSGYFNIVSLRIPDSVTKIGEFAFHNCLNLRNIEIPDSVTEIGYCGFQSCYSLTDIVLPDSVTKIGDYAFSNCESLSGIEIPGSVTEIVANPFQGCKNLTAVTVSPDNKKYAVIDNVLFDSEEKKLVSYPSGLDEAEYRIPDETRVIGDSAFSRSTRLTSIEIPDSVTTIELAAFSSCENLTNIEIPDSVTQIGRAAFAWCESLTGVRIPASVTKIEPYTFSDCYRLTNIEIPDSVTEIEEGAFEGCEQLTLTAGTDSYAAQYAEKHKIPYITGLKNDKS